MMTDATQKTMTDATDIPWNKLCACIDRVHTGPWAFIQLRGEPISERLVDAGDVDLLGSRESVLALIDAACQWVQAGDCHLRLVSRNRHKTKLMLFSSDGAHRIDFDLWVELWQVNKRQTCLRYADCEQLVATQTHAIRRLPVTVEAAVYLNHLQSKRRNVCEINAAARLSAYRDACHTHALDQPMAEIIDTVIRERGLSHATMAATNNILATYLRLPAPTGLCHRIGRVLQDLRTGWLGAPRHPRVVSLVGCDGCGKTTHAARLKATSPYVRTVFTGKHLYRKCLLYKLAVIFIRPLLFQPRETFDETLAPLVYLRACLGLQLKLWQGGQGLQIMDRSILCFLLVKRKTDTPRFCRSRWLANVCGRRVPTIHFILPYAQLSQRKQEFTQGGHAHYAHPLDAADPNRLYAFQ